MKMKLSISLALAVLFILPLPAAGRQKFSVRLSYAMGLAGNSDSASWQEPLHSENTEYQLASETGKSANINLSLGYSLGRSLGLGVGAILHSRDLNATLDVQVPHPFVFDFPRSASGAYASTLKTTVIYLNFIYHVAIRDFAVDVFAGPAFFNSSADILDGVAIQDAFPNETVTISLSTENVKQSSWGIQAGADLNYYFSNSLGVFLEARYLAGGSAFTPGSGTVPEIKLSLGGVTVGAGLVYRF